MNEVPLYALRFRAQGLGFTVQGPHPDEGRILKFEEKSQSLDFSAVLPARNNSHVGTSFPECRFARWRLVQTSVQNRLDFSRFL